MELCNYQELFSLNKKWFETGFPTWPIAGELDNHCKWSTSKSFEQLAADPFWITGIRYDWLVQNRGAVPDRFFDRFNHLQEVTCKTKIDSDHFTKFLAGCQSLQELNVLYCEVGQAFLDELPSFTSLRMLTFYEKDQQQGFDFRFLNRMYRLRRLYTNQNIVKHKGLQLNMRRILNYLYGRLFVIRFDVLDGLDKALFAVSNVDNENQIRLRILSNSFFIHDEKEGRTWLETDLPLKEINYEELRKYLDYWRKKTDYLDGWREGSMTQKLLALFSAPPKP